jgi:hypothetical protein
LERQLDDLDLRLDRLRGLAEETRCDLPRSMLPRNAGFQDDAVLLGIHPPLSSQAPAISEDEAMLVQQAGFMLTIGAADAAAARRNRPGTKPITDEDTGRIGAIGAKLAEIWEFGTAGNSLEQGTRVTASLPMRGARAGAVQLTTPEARITPSGTAFLVHRDARRGWTFVHVDEGTVGVTPVQGGAALYLAAGQSALVTAAGAERLLPGARSGGDQPGGGQPGWGGQPGGSQPGWGGQPGDGGRAGTGDGACFGNDRGAASTRREDHVGYAQRYPTQLAANLGTKIDQLWRCPAMSKDRLDSVFADLSVVIPRYLGYAGCFRGDISVLGPTAPPHREWARQRSREQGQDNARWKTTAAVDCLKGIALVNFYADVSLVLAQALPAGDPGVATPPPVVYPPPVTYPPQPGVKASDWLNRDSPTGNADWEALADLRGSVPCARPTGIECRVVGDKRDWRQAGQRYKCSLDEPNPGGICLNSENPGGCLDYEVRFLCGAAGPGAGPGSGTGAGAAPPVTGIFDRFPPVFGRPGHSGPGSGVGAGAAPSITGIFDWFPPASGAQGPSAGGHRAPPAPSAWPIPTPVFIGCFKDTSDYDLNGYLERSRQNTPQRCIALCQGKGFAYAGVQYGESCLCGNRYGKYGAANNCDYPCTGDRSQMCGGYNANSVYGTGLGTR